MRLSLRVAGVYDRRDMESTSSASKTTTRTGILLLLETHPTVIPSSLPQKTQSLRFNLDMFSTWYIRYRVAPPTGVDKEGSQPRTCGEVVQSWPEDHGIADSYRRHPRIPSGALHASVSSVHVSRYGSRPSTGD